MSKSSYGSVTAPARVDPAPLGAFGHVRITGAWVTMRLGGGRELWVTRFAGTHQRVPFQAFGRTPGRSLRRMRRMLVKAQIPAITY